MDKPVVAAKEPLGLELEPGEYWWCTCGRSKNQPFCDGAHEGTGFQPQMFKVEKKDTYWLCTCKHTANGPFCDGAHELLD